jgi:hypothetical protein
MNSQKDFTTFRVSTVGKFTLTILNQGSNPVNVDGIFGYIHLSDKIIKLT